MCNFDKQDEDTKIFLSIFLKKAAQTVGGVNFLLSLVEVMRKNRPNPLLAKGCKISSEHTTISWNKTVFKDKYELLEELVFSYKSYEACDFNILDGQNSKKRKKLLNMAKTLFPVKFVIKPKNPQDGGGFEFGVFEEFEDECAKLNPIFIALFFCSVEFSKKAIKYNA